MNTAGAKAVRNSLSEKVALGQRPEPGGGDCPGPQEGGPGKRDFQAEGTAKAKALRWECARSALEPTGGGVTGAEEARERGEWYSQRMGLTDPDKVGFISAQ